MSKELGSTVRFGKKSVGLLAFILAGLAFFMGFGP